jgi:hypothetical protein
MRYLWIGVAVCALALSAPVSSAPESRAGTDVTVVAAGRAHEGAAGAAGGFVLESATAGLRAAADSTAAVSEPGALLLVGLAFVLIARQLKRPAA